MVRPILSAIENETFAHWDFATGTKDQIKGVAQFFGLRYFQGNDQIVHGLRTVILSPDGKVVKVYRDNQWKPEEVVSEMIRLAMVIRYRVLIDSYQLPFENVILFVSK